MVFGVVCGVYGIALYLLTELFKVRGLGFLYPGGVAYALVALFKRLCDERAKLVCIGLHALGTLDEGERRRLLVDLSLRRKLFELRKLRLDLGFERLFVDRCGYRSAVGLSGYTFKICKQVFEGVVAVTVGVCRLRRFFGVEPQSGIVRSDGKFTVAGERHGDGGDVPSVPSGIV